MNNNYGDGKRKVWLRSLGNFYIFGVSYQQGRYYPGFLSKTGSIHLPPPIPETNIYIPGHLFVVESPYKEMLKKVLE